MAAYRRVLLLTLFFVSFALCREINRDELERRDVEEPNDDNGQANAMAGREVQQGNVLDSHRAAQQPFVDRLQNLQQKAPANVGQQGGNGFQGGANLRNQMQQNAPGLQQRINPNLSNNVNRGMGYQPQGQDQTMQQRAFHRQMPAQPEQNVQQNQQFNQGEGTKPKRKGPIKIADHPDCAADVKQFCGDSVLTNNFAILDCLQQDKKTDEDISPKCQHFLWNYKKNLTTDMRFDSAASEVCKDAVHQFPECETLEKGTGQIIPCLIENKANISSANCRQFLTKMASIVFSDFRLIYRFTEKCQHDIETQGCGRLHPENEDAPHTQGRTVECLSEHVKVLDDDCKHEILRIAELQSDDYHMDRPLYYACRDDRERFCKRTSAGNGKIFKCLLRHKFERSMSSECREKLVLRQKLMQEDYKVNKGLAENCRKDIKINHCLRGDLPELKQGKLSYILLCLEQAQADGKILSPECTGEVQDMRRSLMEDYKISPDIVVQCSVDIKESCDGGLEREGKTLHCLMDLARNKKGRGPQISASCKGALLELLEEVQPDEDYRMDPTLQEACQSVVRTACKDVKPGDSRVIGCLLDHLDSDLMVPECQERMIEIQYFVSRDFKLDRRLMKQCKEDAAEMCHAPKQLFDPDNFNPELGHLAFSCLYNKLKTRALSRSCAIEVKRTMHQRAVSIELEPRIEEPCMQDLGKLCSDDTNKGDEMECLQDHLEDLTQECQWAVGNFTEDMDEDPQLDRILMRACTPMIKKFCEDLIEKEDAEPGDVMECLINHKHHQDMNRKCSAGIEHHQLITMKDYHFSFKFKESCKSDVMKLCKGIKKKSDVIRCLSETVRNDTLLEEDHRISRQCRRQLRFEMLQKGEDINLNPIMKGDCEYDIKQFCSNVSPGNSRVIECLKKHQGDLSGACHRQIFKREKQEAKDSSIDYLLVTTCKKMIKIHCKDSDPRDLLQCLKESKDEMDFDPRCRKLVLEREETQAKDYRLNPDLEKSCRMDIPKFCSKEVKGANDEKDLEGKVINCLRIKFAQRRLSRDCEEHVRSVVKEAALDYKQDPVLAAACSHEIQDLCLHSVAAASDDNGYVEECLREQLAAKKIQKPACIKEIVRIMAESKADVQVDPLLHRACSMDIKHYCFNVPPGEGRQMSCLLSALDDKTVRLQQKCHEMLSQRLTLWEYAAKVAPPETLSELLVQVTTSKARSYLMIVLLTIIGIIFLGGLFCGRVTKRVRAEIKNK